MALASCFEDESTVFTEGVLDLPTRGAQALAPPIWPLEVANALLVGERRKRVTTAQVSSILKHIVDLPISVDQIRVENVFGAILFLARKERLSEYDASYIELALREGVPLATLDERLVLAARNSGVCAGSRLNFTKASVSISDAFSALYSIPCVAMLTSTKAVPIQTLVQELRRLPESAFIPTEPLRKLLEKTPVDADSLAPYLNWSRQHYTRNLIDRTPIYELMAICWEVGQASSVHNHRDQNCWMAVPVGRLQVENFRLVHQDLASGRCELAPLNTVEMNISQPCAVDPAEPVHRVVNPREFNQRAVSLHVYSRPFDSCVVYSPEQGTCGEIKLHFNTEYGKPK